MKRQRPTWKGVGDTVISASVGLFLCALIVAPTQAATMSPEANLAAGGPAVVINEIMWDGTEYVELLNTTASSINLSGWQLTTQRPDNTTGVSVTFGSADSIAANSFFLLEKSESATTITANKVVSVLTLLNTGEQIILKDPNGAIIDTANVLGAWLAGQNTTNGLAMERTADGADGTLAASWFNSTGSGGGRDGTPGAANSVPKTNQAPTANAGADQTVNAGNAVTLSGEDSADADGDTLTFSWDFGDGALGSGQNVSHAYTTAGTYTATLTVSDGTATSTDTVKIIVSTPTYSTSVVINEFLPNPVGSDTDNEFIELTNLGSSAVVLDGWQLDDAAGGSAPFTIPVGTTIQPGAFLSFSRSQTKIAINNDGETVRLLTPSGQEQSSFSFSASIAEGQAYARTSSGSFSLTTTLTPGQANIITTPATDEEETATTKTSSSSSTPTSTKTGKVAGAKVVSVTLKDVRSQDGDIIITTEGVVSAPPGVFGDKIIYLAGSGIQVYLSSGEYPELSVGTTVKLTGQLSSYLGEARLKIAKATDITAGKTAVPPEPHLLKTGDISEDQEGWLVEVQGKVTQTSGDTFYLDDDSGEVKVYIKSTTSINKPPMKKDQDFTVIGVVSHTTAGYRLLPRFQDDIRLGRVAGLTHFPATGVDYALAFGSLLIIAAWLMRQGIKAHEPLLTDTSA